MNSPMDKFLDENIGDRATYELMAKAIAFIRQNHRQQPDLAAIAAFISRRARVLAPLWPLLPRSPTGLPTWLRLTSLLPLLQADVEQL